MVRIAEAASEFRSPNGRKPRGPTKSGGRSTARNVATTTGVRAEVLAMPGEEPAMVEARVASWNDFYRPLSPAARHLVDRCVAATLLSDRCRLAYDSALADQVDRAAREWEHERPAMVDETWEGLAADPGGTVAALERTGHGCRWLIARWERLGTRLKLLGCWDRADCDEAVRLCSARPTPEGLRDDLTAYLLVLSNLRCRLEPSDGSIAAMLAPGRRPAELEGRHPSSFVFEGATCLKLLGDLVLEIIDQVREAERRANDDDASSRSRALNRALVLRDEAEARLFFRYNVESRSTFHRAYKELLATLKRDDAAREASTVDDSAAGTDPAGEDRADADEPGIGPSTVAAVAVAREPMPPVRRRTPLLDALQAPERRGAVDDGRDGGARATTLPIGPEGGDLPRGDLSSDATPSQGQPGSDGDGPRLPRRGAFRDILEFSPGLRDRLMGGRSTFLR